MGYCEMRFVSRSRGVKYLVKAAILGSLLLSNDATSEQVRHLFDYTTSQFSLESQGACGSLAFFADISRCNPALQRKIESNSGSIEMTGLADEATFNSLWRAVSEPLSEKEAQALFEKYSFATFSGYVRFATSSKWLGFEFIPGSLLGAYRIANPSLPLLQIAGISKSVFSSTFSYGTKDFSRESILDFSLGLRLKMESLSLMNANIDALSTSSQTDKNVIKKERKKKLDADVGAYLGFDSIWMPDLGFVCKNCLKGEDVIEVPGILQVSKVESKHILGHATWEFFPGLGALWLSTLLSWDGIFRNLDLISSGGALGYRVGSFSATASYSPARSGWGFIAQRGFYSIGMQYALEKQPANFQIEREQKLYLTLGAAL